MRKPMSLLQKSNIKLHNVKIFIYWLCKLLYNTKHITEDNQYVHVYFAIATSLITSSTVVCHATKSLYHSEACQMPEVM